MQSHFSGLTLKLGDLTTTANLETELFMILSFLWKAKKAPDVQLTNYTVSGDESWAFFNSRVTFKRKKKQQKSLLSTISMADRWQYC